MLLTDKLKFRLYIFIDVYIMTCFWDGLIKSLDNDDLKKLNIQTRKIIDFIDILKKNVRKTNNVNWQNKPLTENQLLENIEHIKSYDKKAISNGYLCSTCDPFLLLFSELLNLDIVHTYLGNKIIYSNTNSTKIYYFTSNRRHFQFVKKT